MRKYIVFFLILIGIISLGYKLYYVDFSQPFLTGDDVFFALRAIAISQGDFAQSPVKAQGWPLFIAPFFMLTNSENFLDYTNIQRGIALTLSSVSIFAAYLLGRKFFDEKYSLVMATLFAFIPRLNQQAQMALSEPLYILVFIGMFYFILNKDPDKKIFVAFFLAGILWWVRINGLLVILPLLLIYFVLYWKSKNFFRNYLLGITIFFVVISPILLERYTQYGDPLYFSETYNEDYGYSFNELMNGEISTGELLQTTVKGMSKVMHENSYPFLIFTYPIGMILSLRILNDKFYKTTWILLLGTLIPLVFVLGGGVQSRWIFFTFPILIIFSTLAVKEILNNKRSYFHSKLRTKKILLISFFITVVLSSGVFAHGFDKYGLPPKVHTLVNEEIEFTRLMVGLDGKTYWPNAEMEFIVLGAIETSDGGFKNFKINRYKDFHYNIEDTRSFYTGHFELLSIEASTLAEVINNGRENGLKYLVITEDNYGFDFLKDVYENESKYPYLIKKFDSYDLGFEKYKVKAFEINFDEFELYVHGG